MTQLEFVWRRESAPAESWMPLVTLPDTNQGFVEAVQYLFRKPGASWQLRIDDELIPDAAEPGCWLWSPRFFAGEVRAEFVCGRLVVAVSIDVAPDPAKLGRETFTAMLRELWAADPALVIGNEPATRQIGELGANDDPWLQFERFRRYVPEFLEAARSIRTRPRHSLRARRTSVGLHQVRRVDRRTASVLSRNPAAGLLLGREDVGSTSLRLDVPVVEETLDCAANRAMLALGLALIRRGRALFARLQENVEQERVSETETPLGSRWPVRRATLLALVEDLKALLRLTPFADASNGEITAAGLTAVVADPAYARAWNRGWRALRFGIESSPTAERLWISPSWAIYERWCLLQLGRTLARECDTWQWHFEAASLRWTGVRGEATAALEYQPTFRSMAEGATALRSISRQREPDLLLTVVRAQGDQAQFVVFDAKYRVSRANVLDAMSSAHIYRDSLRIGQVRPRASFLLVPAGGGAPWLEQQGFQAEHEVGVVPMAPGLEPVLPTAVIKLLS